MIRRAPRAEASGWQADNRLSWDARGLLAFILAQPDNYRVNRETLAGAGPDGLTVIRTALKELTEAGYISRERVREANGTFTTDTVVFEQPQRENRTPVVGYPPPANQPVKAFGLPDNQSQLLGEQENHSQETPKLRPRDPLYDAYVSVFHCEPKTKSERGQWNGSLKQVRDAGATPDQVRARAGAWRVKYPNAHLTPMALAKHWSSLGPPLVSQFTRGLGPTQEEPPPDYTANVANLRQARQDAGL